MHTFTPKFLLDFHCLPFTSGLWGLLRIPDCCTIDCFTMECYIIDDNVWLNVGASLKEMLWPNNFCATKEHDALLVGVDFAKI